MSHSLQTFALAMVVLTFGYFVVRATYRAMTFSATAEYRKTILDSTWLLDDKHNLNDLEVGIVCSAIIALYDYGYKTKVMQYAVHRKTNGKAETALPVRPEVEAVGLAFAKLAMFENPRLYLRLLNRNIQIANGTKAAKTSSSTERSAMSVARSLPMVDKKRHHGDALPC